MRVPTQAQGMGDLVCAIGSFTAGYPEQRMCHYSICLIKSVFKLSLS